MSLIIRYFYLQTRYLFNTQHKKSMEIVCFFTFFQLTFIKVSVLLSKILEIIPYREIEINYLKKGIC